MNVEFLKQLLSVPSYVGEEWAMAYTILTHCKDKGYEVKVDTIGNVYVTKGKLEPGESYPCVLSHIDTVHKWEDITVEEKHGALIAFDTNGKRAGIGGDDKAGAFICLEILEKFDKIKAGFFVSEECGCVGSRASLKDFFKDVGYFIQFDSPCNDIMSYSCDGVQLFEDNGVFITSIIDLLDKHGIKRWQRHPYTDIAVMKRRYQKSCLNLAAGYFAYHSKNEYVVIADVENSLNLGIEIIEKLGCKDFPFENIETKYTWNNWNEPEKQPMRPISYLVTGGHPVLDDLINPKPVYKPVVGSHVNNTYRTRSLPVGNVPYESRSNVVDNGYTDMNLWAEFDDDKPWYKN